MAGPGPRGLPARRRLPAEHARPAQGQAAGREHLLRRRPGGAPAPGPHHRPRRPAGGGRLHRPRPRQQADRPDAARDQGRPRAAAARPGALQHLLLSVPRPARRRQRHDRAARLQASDLVPHRAAAHGPDRLLLQRDDRRLRRDADLRAADPGARPLGDRRLHPCPPVQPERESGGADPRGPAARAEGVGQSGRAMAAGQLPGSAAPPGRERRPWQHPWGPQTMTTDSIRHSSPAFEAPAAVGFLRTLGLVLGAVGLLGSIVGFIIARDYFFRAGLVGCVFWVGISLGCLAISMLGHLTGGDWQVVIRRVLEASARVLWVPLALLFLLFLFGGLPTLYEWARPDMVKADHVLQLKAPYFYWPHSSTQVPWFFYVRLAVYFIIWMSLAFSLSRLSRRQDETQDLSLISRMKVI